MLDYTTYVVEASCIHCHHFCYDVVNNSFQATTPYFSIICINSDTISAESSFSALREKIQLAKLVEYDASDAYPS